MAIGKRLRFEILRRDNHQCRYCGAKPQDAELRVDHVTPRALGGSDDPSNLVTACEPCNSGKSSATPDAALVADVEQDAFRWARAMRVAAHSMEQEQWINEQRNAGFRAEWDTWTFDGGKTCPLPYDWAATLQSLRNGGLSDELISTALNKAMQASHVKAENTFRYFCGIGWNMVADLQQRARAVVETIDPVDN